MIQKCTEVTQSKIQRDLKTLINVQAIKNKEVAQDVLQKGTTETTENNLIHKNAFNNVFKLVEPNKSWK